MDIPTMPIRMLLDILPEINDSTEGPIDFWDILNDKSTMNSKANLDIPEIITIDSYEACDDETFTLSDDEIEVLPVPAKMSRTENSKYNTVEMLTIEEKEAKCKSNKTMKPIGNQVIMQNGNPVLRVQKLRHAKQNNRASASVSGSLKLIKQRSTKNLLLTSKTKLKFDCVKCTKKFMRETSLQAHMKQCVVKFAQVSNQSEPIIYSSNCPKCEKGFSNEHDLKAHKELCFTNLNKLKKKYHEPKYDYTISLDTKTLTYIEKVKGEAKPKNVKTERKVIHKPCGYCDGCRLLCGKCEYCIKMPLFGGVNENKFACKLRPENCENTEKHPKKLRNVKQSDLPKDCKVCGKIFKKPISDCKELIFKAYLARTRSHIKICGKEATLPCEFCENKYRSQHLLNCHVRRYHVKQFKCDACSYKCGSNYELQKHKLYKHDGVSYTCELCGIGLAYETGYYRHMKSVHGGNSFPCSQCPYMSNTEQQVKRHERSMHSGFTFNCKSCTSKLHSKKSLEIHERGVHGTMTFGCDKCDYQTKRQECLGKHKLFVHGGKKGKKHPCTICGHTKTKKSYLVKHMFKIHGV